MQVPIKLIVRRTFVATAVVGSVAGGAATIQAAGQWTASSAPMAAPPVNAEAIAQQLTDERTRADDLQARLDAVTTRTADLATALEEATGKVSTDAKSVEALQKQLTSAQKKLAALKAKMAKIQAASPPTRAASVSAPRVVAVTRHVVVKKVAKAPSHAKTAASGKPGEGDDDGGKEHDDD